MAQRENLRSDEQDTLRIKRSDCGRPSLIVGGNRLRRKWKIKIKDRRAKADSQPVTSLYLRSFETVEILRPDLVRDAAVSC